MSRTSNIQILSLIQKDVRKNTSLPVWKWKISTGSTVFSARRRFRFDNLIFRPEVTLFQCDVTSSLKVHFFDRKWCHFRSTNPILGRLWSTGGIFFFIWAKKTVGRSTYSRISRSVPPSHYAELLMVNCYLRRSLTANLWVVRPVVSADFKLTPEVYCWD